MTNEHSDRAIPQHDRSTNEQDRFLDYCQRNEIQIKVYLDSGRALQGKIVDHDRKCILLGATRVEKIPKMIPKSYIALVRAEEILPLFLEYKGRGNYITRKKARKKKKVEMNASDQVGSGPIRKPRPAQCGNANSTPTPPKKASGAVEVTVKKTMRSKIVTRNKKPSTPPELRDDDAN
ncbi:MAG: RNA chaperone Hfq (plasmid) [Pseudomonas rhizophila]|uniref:RNA chaperone Hfq n=1 Tax=Pseudomonas rhizophila TaxID=2045200 RepID=UPI003F6C5BEC